MEKSNIEWAKDIPCRNVIIYGYCKKQTEGCPFRHENDEEASNVDDTNHNTEVSAISEPADSTSNNKNEIIHSNNTNSLKSLQLNTQTDSAKTIVQPIPTPSVVQPPQTAESLSRGLPNSPTPGSVPKFNAKTSASFTPMGSNKVELNTMGNNNMETAGNSAGVSVNSNPPQSIASNNHTLSSFTTSFDPYAAQSFTPTASSGNLTNVALLHGDKTDIQVQQMQQGPQLHQLQQVIPTQPPPQGQIPQQQPIPVAFSSQQGLPHHPPTPSSANYNTYPMSQMSSDPSVIGAPAPHFPHPNVGLKYPTIYPPPHSLLQYHLYAPDPPPHFNLSLKPNEQLPESLFIPNNLRIDLVKKNMAALQIFPPGGLIPDVVQDYFGLVLLDYHKQDSVSRENKLDYYYGHSNSLYKVFSNVDGKIYLLRRIHDAKAIDPAQLAHNFQEWNSVSSTNIVKLKDLFTTTKFGDTSLCAIYDYFPLSNSLYETHFVNFPLESVTQNYLWTYLVQITNAMKCIHAKGLSIGDSLNWNKIIVTGSPGRIKVTSSDVFKILDPNFNQASNTTSTSHSNDVLIEQQKDYSRLGLLLKQLSKTMKPSNNSTATNEFNNSTISNSQPTKSNISDIDELPIDDNFKKVLKYLLDETNTSKSIKSLSSIFAEKMFEIIDSSQSFAEYTESILSKELENGRLFRLICKLNCIFGRMESRVDINWSDSGEKFPIILFYDYVFHQVDETGKPFIDLTHVLRCLNKLDCGVAEKIMLVTPDEMNCIIISYKELKQLVETTFRALTQ